MGCSVSYSYQVAENISNFFRTAWDFAWWIPMTENKHQRNNNLIIMRYYIDTNRYNGWDENKAWKLWFFSSEILINVKFHSFLYPWTRLDYAKTFEPWRFKSLKWLKKTLFATTFLVFLLSFFNLAYIFPDCIDCSLN